jgi:hypothetical protein
MRTEQVHEDRSEKALIEHAKEVQRYLLLVRFAVFRMCDHPNDDPLRQTTKHYDDSVRSLEFELDELERKLRRMSREEHQKEKLQRRQRDLEKWLVQYPWSQQGTS